MTGIDNACKRRAVQLCEQRPAPIAVWAEISHMACRMQRMHSTQLQSALQATRLCIAYSIA